VTIQADLEWNARAAGMSCGLHTFHAILASDDLALQPAAEAAWLWLHEATSKVYSPGVNSPRGTTAHLTATQGALSILGRPEPEPEYVRNHFTLQLSGIIDTCWTQRKGMYHGLPGSDYVH
jgi:hypothetical protein